MSEFLEVVNTVLPLVLVFLLLYFVHIFNKTVVGIMDDISDLYKELAESYKLVGELAAHLTDLEIKVYGVGKEHAWNKKRGHDDIVDA